MVYTSLFLDWEDDCFLDCSTIFAISLIFGFKKAFYFSCYLTFLPSSIIQKKKLIENSVIF